MTKRNSYQLLNKNRTMKWVFLTLFAFIIIFLLYIFRVYIWVFLFSLIFFVALKPLFDRLYGKFKSRSLSATVITILMIILVLTPSMILVFSFSEQANNLYKRVDTSEKRVALLESIEKNETVERIFNYIEKNTEIERSEISEKLLDYIRRTSFSISQGLTLIILYPINFVVKFLLMMVIIFFLLKDSNKIDDSIYKSIPLPDDIEKDIVKRLKEVIYILILGNMVIMCLQGLMVGLGMFWAGVQMPLLWGTIAAILSLIPVVGTIIIWAPVALYFIFTGQYATAAFLSIWCFAWYNILENLVKPKAFGDRLNFHPLIFFFLLLGSIQAFGLPGVIIGPILLSLFYSFWEIYKLLDAYDMGNKIKEDSDEEPIVVSK